MNKTLLNFIKTIYCPFQRINKKWAIRNEELGMFLVSQSLLAFIVWMLLESIYGFVLTFPILEITLLLLYMGFGYTKYFPLYTKCKGCHKIVVSYGDKYCMWCGTKQKWF